MVSPPRLFARKAVIFGGMSAFALFIVYLSASTEHGVTAPLSFLSQQNWNSEDDTSNNFPKDLQLTFSQFNSRDNLQAGDEGASPPKRILIWNSYWESKALWNKIFAEIVYKRCPQSNCELSVDRSDVNKSDAVLFHLVDIPAEKYEFPANRNPNQIWIGMTYEPPYILQFAGVDFNKLNGIFNRTMSYRTDGDIVVRHGTFSTMSESQTIPPSYTSRWINSHESTNDRNYASGKRRLVAWFASSRNCRSQSGREKYINELQGYIEVDIYGSCGPYKCGTQKTMRHPYKVEEDDCYMLISLGYKFVLAFENSLCEDYVTEKLYNHLKLNVVPVVFGASNYSLFAPPNSVIDASRYTPEELATYLQRLDKNDTLYNTFFDWKKDYVVESHDGVPLACDLCEQLHNPNWQVEKKVYDQFDKWIVSGCHKGYGEP